MLRALRAAKMGMLLMFVLKQMNYNCNSIMIFPHPGFVTEARHAAERDRPGYIG